MEMVDHHAVDALLNVATSFSPRQARGLLELIRRALPTMVTADSLEAERSLVRAIARRWDLGRDPESGERMVASLLRELLHYCPSQREAVVEVALARVDQAAALSHSLRERQLQRLRSAVAHLDPKAKAAFRVLDTIIRVSDSFGGQQITNQIARDLNAAPIKALLTDPAWKELLKIYDTARLLEEIY
jgi:hypothetical protein